MRKLPVALAPFALLAAPVSAQWEDLDGRNPFVLEMVSATNLILERWPSAVQHYEKLVARDPEDGWARLHLAAALRQDGQLEAAMEAAEGALPFPAVTARAALEFARAAALAGDTGTALAFLDEARAAELVLPRDVLKRDPDLAELRGAAEFDELLAQVGDVAGRYATLADADDHAALVLLWRAHTALHWEDLPHTLWVLHDDVDAYVRAAERSKEADAAALGRRLLRGARAADEAAGCALYTPWIESVLAWDEGQRDARSKLWKEFRAQDGKIRGHRFTQVLETLEGLAREAQRLGDLPASYAVDRARGLVHSAILSYSQPRRGVSREQEYGSGVAAFERRLDLARRLDDPDAEVDAYDFLLSFEQEERRRSLADVEDLVFQAFITTTRVEPAAREFGMFESMWRDLKGAER